MLFAADADGVFVRDAIRKDIKAIYQRDPACFSYVHALLYLKGFHALQAHRIQHALWKRGQRLLALTMQARISTVFAMDLHPAARLGKGILIDHGTGVVIGETSHIGNNVKLYQGVTLGAKSFPLDKHGRPIKHIQRHPTVEDHVIIYANSTILGGDTILGERTVVAGNVFLMESTPPDSFVTRAESGVQIRTRSQTKNQDGI